MADIPEGGQRQQTQFPNREAVTRDITSDDAQMQVAETARLQAEAQARIDKTRHDHIGSAP